MKTLENFTKVENARGTAFNLFTALLCQPEKNTETAKMIEMLDSTLAEVSSACHDSLIEMKNAYGKGNPEELLVEYARLFVGPFKMLAPPYSSVYFNNGTSLMSDETLWAIDFYNKMRFAFNEKVEDAPDHIAVECEFIYSMIYHEMKFLRSGKIKKAKKYWTGQKNFIEKHFIKWAPDFCDKIIEHATHEYFKMLGKSFKIFITEFETPSFPLEKPKEKVKA